MSDNPPKTRACLFDVDGPPHVLAQLIVGLLIDSETISTEGINIYLASHGKEMLPADIQAKMRGILYYLGCVSLQG